MLAGIRRNYAELHIELYVAYVKKSGSVDRRLCFNAAGMCASTINHLSHCSECLYRQANLRHRSHIGQRSFKRVTFCPPGHIVRKRLKSTYR